MYGGQINKWDLFYYSKFVTQIVHALRVPLMNSCPAIIYSWENGYANGWVDALVGDSWGGVGWVC